MGLPSEPMHGSCRELPSAEKSILKLLGNNKKRLFFKIQHDYISYTLYLYTGELFLSIRLIFILRVNLMFTQISKLSFINQRVNQI